MDAYRSAPAARVIHTRLRDLPPAMQTVLLEGLRKGHRPPAIPLTSQSRGGLVLLGLVVSLATVVLYNFRSSMYLLPSSNAHAMVPTAVVGASLVMTGALLTLQAMSLRLKPLAILYPEGWLACATGIGSHLDLIPLMLVDTVVPLGVKRLEVRLRTGQTLLYGLSPTRDLGFFSEARTAVAAAAGHPPLSTHGLDKQTPRPRRGRLIAIGVTLGSLVGGAGAVWAIAWDATRHAHLAVEQADQSLARIPEPDSTDTPDEARVRALEYFFERTANDRATGGLPAMLYEATGIAAHEARLRPILDQARAAVAVADDAGALNVAGSATSSRELRQLITEHSSDAIGETARARLAQLVVAAREREVAAGASPAALAVCDWLTAHGRRGESPLVEVVPMRTGDFTGEPFREYPDAINALSAGYEAVWSDVILVVQESIANALGVNTNPAPGGLGIRIEVMLFPGREALQYTLTNERTHAAVSSYSVPVLHARVRTVYSWNGQRFEQETTHQAAAQPMEAHNMAVAYPTPSRLYEAEGRDIGGRIGRTVARTLCLP